MLATTTDAHMEKLQEISDVISTKKSHYLTFNSNKTSFNTRFPNPIKFNHNRNYEMALQYFSTSNYQINIEEENNKFIYSHDSGTTWTTITFEKGAYEIKDIDDEIRRQMIVKGHTDKSATAAPIIKIGIILSTFKSFVEITNSTYKVDFSKPKTIRTLLGFDSVVISKGYNTSNSTVQISSSAAILIHCDLVSGSYHNGVESDVLYSFPAFLVPVGYKINVFPPQMIYLPINRDVISSIRFYLTDESNNPLDFKEEEITLGVHIRQV